MSAKLLEVGPDPAAIAQLDVRLQDWRPQFEGTLVFVVDGSRVLLIEKKTGHGAGKVNAPGGKLEAGELPVACARREVLEEVGVRVDQLNQVARLKFVDTHWPQWFGHAFVTSQFSGEPTETAEAKPFWCALDALPYRRMWDDDRIWLPRVLPTGEHSQIPSGEQLLGEFLFTRGKLGAYRCYRGDPCA